MSKRLIVCCDGTWNTPDQRSSGSPTPTNVSKVALALSPKGLDGREQRTFYHRGVGTNRWERIRGGAFGFGLSRDVRETYRFLVQNFDPGDELFFFGFSRGAFTARSTAGFVRNSGILRREHVDRVDEAYELYRSRSSATHPRNVEATLFRRSYSHETGIRFIGVWDTVGALGIPIDGLRWFNRRWQFHDTSLSTTVQAAFQALAIDEKRGPFRPTLWKPQGDAPKDQRIEQVWFVGVHCDVGGGYQEHELSDIPLLWMVERAHECGLSFEPKAFIQTSSAALTPGNDGILCSLTTVEPDPLGQEHDSYTGFYRLMRPFVRQLGISDEVREYAASAAVERYQRIPSYRPSGLVAYLNGSPRIMPVESTPR